jgi:hypothetical protein
VRVAAITGLVKEQVDEVVKRVAGHLGTGEIVRPGGRPCALGLYDSVVLVIHLLRRNPVQAVAAGFFGVSQATVSRLGPAAAAPGDGRGSRGPCSRADLAAIGPVPVPGARHDAHAYAVSGLKDLMDGRHPPTRRPRLRRS